MRHSLDPADLNAVTERARDAFASMRGARVLIAGGTGFVGTWLVETFAWANARLDLGATLEILAREPARARERFGIERDSRFAVVTHGDVETFDAAAVPDLVVDAAAPRTGPDADQAAVARAIEAAGARTLAIATAAGNVPLLYTSSGAVYGRQPPELAALAETYAGEPDPHDPRMSYHRAKRTVEAALVAAAGNGARAKIARLFAFVAPHLPLDRHFAAGNFIRDALRGAPIAIGGDGTPVRTYLYGSDLAIWSWIILTSGIAGRAYNVGSERSLTIAELARSVARAAGREPDRVTVAELPNGAPPERYVPDTTRARTELGLTETVDLTKALERTLAFHRRADARAAR